MRLKKLVVKNFKSLRDCEIELDKFNVLIGPNASGKTNLVEVFKLLRKIYVERDDNPFLEWWGYNNVVWAGREELPITVGMLFDVEGYDVYFETTFTGTGGSFRILKEIIKIREYIEILKNHNILRIHWNEDWFENMLSELLNNDAPSGFKERFFKIVKNSVKNGSLEITLSKESSQKTILDFWKSAEAVILNNVPAVFSIHYQSIEDMVHQNNAIPLIIPNLKFSIKHAPPGIAGLSLTLTRFLKRVLTLRQVYMMRIRIPQYSRKETTLNEDASNLVPLLYNIWLREGRLPDEIVKPLSMAFPNTRVFFQLTEDGRVMMKVFENDLELASPCISDGFYKVLALLTAVYLKPPLLIIDEIENSLHPETLELIIDTLRESESQVIITTHSPVVVDIVEPSDLVLVDKEKGETVFKRIRNPEKIKKFLNEKGITLSEGWLYGSLFENDEQ